MLPIRIISYLSPMCYNFWEKCTNSHKIGLGCSTPLRNYNVYIKLSTFSCLLLAFITLPFVQNSLIHPYTIPFTHTPHTHPSPTHHHWVHNHPALPNTKLLVACFVTNSLSSYTRKGSEIVMKKKKKKKKPTGYKAGVEIWRELHLLHSVCVKLLTVYESLNGFFARVNSWTGVKILAIHFVFVISHF